MTVFSEAISTGLLASLAVAAIFLRRISGGWQPALLVVCAIIVTTVIFGQMEPSLGTIQDAGQRIFQRI